MSASLRLMLFPFTVLILLLVIYLVAVDQYLKSSLMQRAEEDLYKTAKSLASSLTLVEQHLGDAVFDQLADEVAWDTALHISIYDPRGDLIGDSRLPVTHMHDEAERLPADAERALIQGEAFAEEIETFHGEQLIYVAVRSAQIKLSSGPHTHAHEGGEAEEQHGHDHEGHGASAEEEHGHDHEAHETLTKDDHGHQHDGQTPQAEGDHPAAAAGPQYFIVRAGLPERIYLKELNEIRMVIALMALCGLGAVFFTGFMASRQLTTRIREERDVLSAHVESRTRDITQLQNVGSLLAACSSLEEVNQLVQQVAVKLLPDTRGSVSMIKNSRNRLDVFSNWQEGCCNAESFLTGDCWALRKGHQHLSTEQGFDVSCGHLQHQEGYSLCVPLLAQGETIGVLHLTTAHSDDCTQLTRMAGSFAEQLGLALANIKLREDLRQQAIRDPLTGLYNRRYMQERLEQEQMRIKRSSGQFGIMMIDLDHFKRFNDTFGHEAGDLVLKKVADEMRRVLRLSDVTCRYGGEEFAILCPDLDSKDTLIVAEKVRLAISEMKLELGGTLGTVTLSVGVTASTQSERSIKELIAEADDALYRAKSQGRNRVCAADGIEADLCTDSYLPDSAGQAQTAAKLDTVPEV